MIDIVARVYEATRKRIKQSPHPMNRASEAGHPCERFLVAARTKQNLLALHDVALQRIFDEGNVHERAVIRELEDAGFEIVEQQRPFEWPEFQLSGRIDAKIKDESVNLNKPLEVKSCSPNVFLCVKKFHTAEDFTKAKQTWLRKYPAQLMSYLLMDDKGEEGIFIFKNKSTGELHQIDITIDFAYMEEILKKLERVNNHVKAGTFPAAELIDECKGCGFAKSFCFVGQDFGPGFELGLLSNEEWISKLERIKETEEAAKENDELLSEVKDFFRGRQAIVGNFAINSKAYTTTSYSVPKEIKEQYAEKKEAFRVTIKEL